MRKLMVLLIMSIPCLGAVASGARMPVVLVMVAFVMFAVMVTGRREASDSAGGGANRGEKGGS